MINFIAGEAGIKTSAFIGILFAFAATCLVMWKGMGMLPRDQGREFAVDGKKSAGKPRGAGFLFVLVFIAAALLFGQVSRDMIIYLILTGAAMITGFLDDCAKTINVTNCSDGVDGLSGTLTMITLMIIYLVDLLQSRGDSFSYLILLFCVCILGYLWYNATPSRLMMGDAGSRAMGLFISIAVLKTGSPFLYIPVALVLILDGGLGLVKIFLLRFLKIRILTKVRTPLHDQARKVWEWSNTQTVFRFAIIQIMLGAAVIFIAM